MPLQPDPAREIAAGDVFAVRYPFTFDIFEFHGEDGIEKRVSWKPGTHVERGDYWDESCSWADAEGEMILSVFGVCALGAPYKTRVLYRRQFRNPQGGLFGKTALRMATIDQFRRMASGFRYAYEIEASHEAQAALNCDSRSKPLVETRSGLDAKHESDGAEGNRPTLPSQTPAEESNND